MNEVKRLVRRFSDLRKSGETPWTVALKALDKLSVYGSFPYQKRRLSQRHYDYQGRNIPFFVHHYNATWRNERCLEIALAFDFLSRTKPQSWLELGNVMRYYSSIEHDVIDKYEKGDAIWNLDFVGFQPPKAYDAFVSISTVEHIGWDESVRDPRKILEALTNIKNMVQNKEHVFLTAPLGYNDYLDDLVRNKEFCFQKETFYVRVNRQNDWQQCSRDEALRHPYGKKFQAANALWVGEGL